MKFQLYQMADVSTGHITREDGILILCEGAPHRIAEADPVDPGAEHGPGSIFTVPGIVEDMGPEVLSEELREFGFSQAFTNIMLELQRQGVPYVKFDRDAPEIEGAPTFDW